MYLNILVLWQSNIALFLQCKDNSLLEFGIIYPFGYLSQSLSCILIKIDINPEK